MAYKTNIQFVTDRINEWADILSLCDTDAEAFASASAKFADYYGDQWRRTAWLNLYELTQGYGGPEEGGWWFDVREPVSCVPVNSHQDAILALEFLNRYAEAEYSDRREYYSAAGGADGHIVFEMKRGQAEPSERPHYE